MSLYKTMYSVKKHYLLIHFLWSMISSNIYVSRTWMESRSLTEHSLDYLTAALNQPAFQLQCYLFPLQLPQSINDICVIIARMILRSKNNIGIFHCTMSNTSMHWSKWIDWTTRRIFMECLVGLATFWS